MMNPTETLKDMKVTEFMNFGTPLVAYIKPIDLAGGIHAYAVHAADGEPLGIESSEDMAVIFARQKNLMAVKVQ